MSEKNHSKKGRTIQRHRKAIGRSRLGAILRRVGESEGVRIGLVATLVMAATVSFAIWGVRDLREGISGPDGSPDAALDAGPSDEAVGMEVG